MENKEFKTILVRASRTKNNKSVVDYMYLDTSMQKPDYSKGWLVGQVWNDSDVFFSNLKDSDFGEVLKGTFTYVLTSKGTMIPQLVKAETKDGKVIIGN